VFGTNIERTAGFYTEKLGFAVPLGPAIATRRVASLLVFAECSLE
jgi:hypothetical protein